MLQALQTNLVTIIIDKKYKYQLKSKNIELCMYTAKVLLSFNFIVYL